MVARAIFFWRVFMGFPVVVAVTVVRSSGVPMVRFVVRR